MKDWRRHLSFRPSTRAVALAIILAAIPAQGADNGAWALTRLHSIPGFQVPESVLPLPGTDIVFVSNIEAAEEQYWSDDKEGYISAISPAGVVKNRRALDSSADAVLHAPKGMALLKDGREWLYFTDNTALKRWPVAGGAVETVPLPGGKRLNDAATDGEAVYVSDTEAGVVHRVAPGGEHREIQAPPGVNGLAFHNGRMFCVSWSEHEVYELDASGKAPPRPFGLAAHFTALDGIVALDGGSLVVSDFPGNKVALVAPDGKTVTTLVALETPADIGLDPERMLLYVPQFMKDTVVIFKLEKK